MLTTKASLLDNPYKVGSPLKQGQLLTGREDIIELVQDTFALRQRQAVILYGQRRIGKTSILLSVKETLNLSQYAPVFFDFMFNTRSFGDTLYNLAWEINRATFNLKPSEFNKKFAQGFKDEELEAERYFQHEFLPQIWQYLGERRLVLLLDEIDTLRNPQNEEAAGINTISVQAFQFLGRLLREEPKLLLVGVLGYIWSPQALPEILHEAFLDAAFLPVTYLEPAYAEALIRIAEQRDLLVFEPGSVAAILDLTAGHPYFLQLLCSEVYNFLYRHDASFSDATPVVTTQVVEAVLPKVFASGEEVLDTIWRNFEDPREQFILAVVAALINQTGSTVTLAQIVNVLVEERVSTVFVEDVAEKLLEIGVFRRNPDQQEPNYGFKVDILRCLLKQTKPVSKIRQELDKLDRVAYALFEEAESFREDGNDEAAIENLLRMRKPGNSNEKVELILIDMVLFESHDTAESFWKNVSRQMLNKVTDANAREVIQDFIKEADFTALSIGALFGDLALADYRFVFFLDNFDHILDLKDLLASNFLGSLRSHSGASDYYRLIVSVQGRLSELSNATKKLNPHASSFVNAYPVQSIEVFSEEEAQELLAWGDDSFDETDKRLILELAGRHPFRLQMAASILYDLKDEKGILLEEIRLKFVNRFLLSIDDHFDELWQLTKDKAKIALAIMALDENDQLTGEHDFSVQVKDLAHKYSSFLEVLQENGLVFKTDKPKISAHIFTLWITRKIVSTTEDDGEADFIKWITGQETIALGVTYKERDWIVEKVKKMPSDWIPKFLGKILVGAIGKPPV